MPAPFTVRADARQESSPVCGWHTSCLGNHSPRFSHNAGTGDEVTSARTNPASVVSGGHPELPVSPAEIVVGELVIDVAGHEVKSGRGTVRLTFLEFELLRILAATPGRVFKRRELIELLWHGAPPSSLRTVDIHVSRVRRKLGEPFGAMIETVRQVGYKFAPTRARPIMKLVANPSSLPRRTDHVTSPG